MRCPLKVGASNLKKRGFFGSRFGVDLGDSYRAEIRDGPAAGGGVRGVYSFLRPDGTPVTVAYAKAPGPDGVYRTVPGGPAALPGVRLPPFPHSLYSPLGQPRPYLAYGQQQQQRQEDDLQPYGALAVRNKMDEIVEDDFVVVQPPQPACNKTHLLDSC